MSDREFGPGWLHSDVGRQVAAVFDRPPVADDPGEGPAPLAIPHTPGASTAKPPPRAKPPTTRPRPAVRPTPLKPKHTPGGGHP